jgi:hypothetical protein
LRPTNKVIKSSIQNFFDNKPLKVRFFSNSNNSRSNKW